MPAAMLTPKKPHPCRVMQLSDMNTTCRMALRRVALLRLRHFLRRSALQGDSKPAAVGMRARWRVCGSNLDCRTATSRLCWRHRDIILTRFGGHASCSGESALAVGARHAAGGYRESDTVRLVGVCGPALTDAAFTWSTARKLLHIR